MKCLFCSLPPCGSVKLINLTFNLSTRKLEICLPPHRWDAVIPVYKIFKITLEHGLPWKQERLFHLFFFFCVCLFCLGGLRWYFCIKCAANWHFWFDPGQPLWSSSLTCRLTGKLIYNQNSVSTFQTVGFTSAPLNGCFIPRFHPHTPNYQIKCWEKCLPTFHHLWSLKMCTIKCQHRTGVEKACRMRCVMCVSAQPEPTVLSLLLTETLTAGSMSPHSLFTTITGMWGTELVLFNSPWMWIIFEKKIWKKRLFFAH